MPDDRRRREPPSVARRLLTFVSIFVPVLAIIYAVQKYAGPYSSGALSLLSRTGVAPRAHDLPADYVPVHKGYISLGTGLYVREDEDLVVRGTPPLILKRTYRSNDERSRPFGVGATHDGEWFVIGDVAAFRWVAIVLADGSQIRFERTSPGSSWQNAMFEHRSTPSEFFGARLGWIGSGWAMRYQDGRIARFEGCDGRKPRPCGLIETRDADGHTVYFRRDSIGRLLRIETTDKRWIAFDYDRDLRVTRAFDSTGHAVDYRYDPGGRLVFVSGADKTERRYTYSDSGNMLTVREPGITIENSYNFAGLCVRQVDRFADSPEPWVLNFAYRQEAGRIVETRESRSDGSWVVDQFDVAGYTKSQSSGTGSTPDRSIVYERDPTNKDIETVTVTCRDRANHERSHSRVVGMDDVRWTEWDLVTTYCKSTDADAR